MQACRTANHPVVMLLLVTGALFALAAITLSSWIAVDFASFLPQADTWQHIDAFVASKQGLQIGWLFEHHNGIHLIAIPKLVYYLDIALTSGSGTVVARCSLVFLLLTPLLVSIVIWQQTYWNRTEKSAFTALAWILLASPMQADSLLNPANLQWSVFAFTITLTAFCADRYLEHRNRRWIVFILLSLLLNALTSATVWLAAAPVLALLLSQRYGFYRVLIVAITATVIAISAISILGENSLFYLGNIADFVMQYLMPFASKPQLEPFSRVFMLAGLALYILVLYLLCQQRKTPIFFLYLLMSLLFIALAIALVRSTMGPGFTFRFINLPLLCLFATLVLLYTRIDSIKKKTGFWAGVCVLGLLVTWINIKDTAETLFFRNQLRMIPIAYALDIQQEALVAELPGFDTGSFDFDDVMTQRKKLEIAGLGIYASSAYALVGKPVHESGLTTVKCEHRTETVTRLNHQPVYGMDGASRDSTGGPMNNIWITDMHDRVIGIGVPVIHRRNLRSVFIEDKTWTAYFNPALGEKASAVQVYAHNEKSLCEPVTVSLPE